MPEVQHVVLIKFKQDITEDQIVDVYAQLEELKEWIPGILSFAGGPYSSPEGLNQGYTHGFSMIFESIGARDDYLPHPKHEQVKAAILPLIDSVIAFDFEL